jgi:exodeoxyribonuclease-3
MKIATWNVNGIRARQAQVHEWMVRERPDVICLQEIKASPDQVPTLLCELEGYWCYWHGVKGYSGVALHVRKESYLRSAALFHTRPLMLKIALFSPRSDHRFNLRPKWREGIFPRSCASWRPEAYAEAFQATGAPLVLCGDLNVARAEIDVHPKELKTSRHRPASRGACAF